jgi:sugar phosphate isomerase/epimerase
MSYTMARGLKAGERLDVKALCEFTRELALDAIDWVTTYGHAPAGVRKITGDYGLKTCCYTFFCDLNFATAKERAAGRDAFKKGVEAAVVLGTDKIMLPIPGKAEFSREQSFQNVIAGLKEAIGFADKAGIIVTVENFPAHRSPFVVSSRTTTAT